MNAKEARIEAYQRTRSSVFQSIHFATQRGRTRTDTHIDDCRFLADLARELTADGYRVIAGEYEGDIVIDWSTP